MSKYSLLRRRTLSDADLRSANWDLLVSAFNGSERVQRLWATATAGKRVWAVHREYQYAIHEYPVDAPTVDSSDFDDEAAFVSALVAEMEAQVADIGDASVAVDITGFMRPELVYLVRLLHERRVARVDFLYSEPRTYVRKLLTDFSKGDVQDVRLVVGCEGIHEIDSANDLLVIGTGYDDAQMAAVAEYKSYARKVLLFGFPSLAPDMYQENVWRVSQAAESIGSGFEAAPARVFAPANDPFATAEVVSRLVLDARRRDGVSNVYLSPLGTKVQALGFGLYFAIECGGVDATSIVLPVLQEYEKRTSREQTRIWCYSVPFALL